jgi:uncharacterized protein YjbI with pentapeptide repeats
MKAQTRLSHPPHSWRSRAVACGLMVWALGSNPIGLWADDNQSDFGDSAPFPLDTTDQATYGMGDSNGFPLDTGGDDGTVKSGSGMSPSPGFRLDTRSDSTIVDFNQSGMGEFGPFTLDTGGPPSSYENNQSDFNDSGGFKLDTNDPILSGFSDSPGFPLDTGGENGEIKTDSGDSAGFPLDTRDSGSNGNLAQFDFNDSNGFPLDTGGSSGSAPNQAPAFQSDGNLSIPENQAFVFDFNATDPDGDTLTYSLPYGDDHLLFDINTSTGILTFLTPKDFESPEDNNSDNRYEATVQVSDGNASATLNLFVQVTDIVENSSDYRGVDISSLDLSGQDLANALFDENTVFSTASPGGGGPHQGANLSGTGADLSNIPFGAVDFRGVNLAGVNLSNANLNGAQFDHQTIFSAPNPGGGPNFAANLSNTNGTGAILADIAPSADLRGVNLTGVRLSTPNFTGLMDHTTVFSMPNPNPGAVPTHIGANLSGSNANLANIPMATVDFRGVNLSGVNLSNSDLANALFDEFTVFSSHDPGSGQSSAANLLGTGANLSNIPFVNVDFRGVNLAGVNLSNANLSNALFDHQTVFSAPNPGGGPNFAANLSNTNGTGAILAGIAPSADLRGVNLTGVRLSTPNFTGLMDHTTVFSMTNPAGGVPTHIGANLFGSDANLANIPMATVDFRGVNLSGVNLSNSDLANALFDEFTVFSSHDPGSGQSSAANLFGTGANLSNIPFVNVDFGGVNLAGVNLSNANLSNALFNHQTVFSAPNPGGGPNLGANLSNTNNTGAILASITPNADLRGVNLAGVRLSTPGFTGLMDHTTVFSMPNPAGGVPTHIGADLSGSDAMLSHIPMATVDFRGVNLSGVNLSNSDLANALFDENTVFSTASPGGGPQQGANLFGTGANLSNIPFVNIDFGGVNLAGVNLSNANLSNALFNHQTVFSAPNPGGGPNLGANLSNTNNTGAILASITPNADLRGVNLTGVRLSTPGFTGLMDHTTVFSMPNPAGGVPTHIGANLSGSNASLANRGNMAVDFRGVNLSGVNFTNTDLSNAQFDQLTVFSSHDPGSGQSSAANLGSTNANLANIPFVNVDFRGVNLAGVNLSNADLSNAQFNHQTIFSVSPDATIAANLSNTNNTGAVLAGIAPNTDLRGVNLGSLNLVGLDLSGTQMDANTILTSATYSSSTLWPAGIDPVAKGAILVSGNQAPSITSPVVANVAENQTFVIDVNATDPDGDSLTYSIAGGSDQSIFEINATTGVLRFKNAPDFEANASVAGNNAYLLIVQASDGSADANQTITVNVTDVAESGPNTPPVFTSPAIVNIAENQTFAMDVNATDPDGDSLAYSITGGLDQAKFEINATTGVLLFQNAPDFEANASVAGNNTYLVIVQASDGSADANQTITVNVTNVVESGPNNPPVFSSPSSTNAPENQTFAIDVNATDPDQDTLAYSIIGGSDQALFELNSTSGVLTFKNAPDFEANASAAGNNSYLVIVQASDGSDEANQTITVNVTDQSESPSNDFRGQDISLLDLSGQDLTHGLFDHTTIFSNGTQGANLSNLQGNGANLSDMNLLNVDFRGVNLAGVNLSNADLSGALFDHTTIFSMHDPASGQAMQVGANLSNGDPQRAANLSGMNLMNVDFRGVNLAGVNLSNADLSGALFDHTTIFSMHDPASGQAMQVGANLSNGDLHRAANLAGMNLMNVDFRGVNLAGVNLSNADLSGALFDHTTIFSMHDPASGQAMQVGANLSNGDPHSAANLAGMNLMNVDFRGVNLAGVNLSNADLNGALFDHTTIFSTYDPASGQAMQVGANLSNGDPHRAANLAGMNLMNVDFRGVNLAGVNLSNADLSGALFDHTTIFSIHDPASGQAMQVGANLSNDDPHRAANLAGMNLMNVDFRGVNLAGVNLQASDLSQSLIISKFDHDIFSRTTLTNSTFDLTTQWPLHLDPLAEGAILVGSAGGISPQSITFDPPIELGLSMGVYQLSAYATSGLPVVYSVDDPTVGTVAGNILSLLEKGTITITVSQVGDGPFAAAPSITKTIVIVDDSGTTNSPPVLPAFAAPLRIAENSAIGSVVGHLEAFDPDPNDTLTFSIPPVATDSLFHVEANGSVRTTFSVDFEKNASHLLFFRVTDGHGAFVDGNVTVEVIDLFRPYAETGIAESITETSASLQGVVIDDGGMPVTERGFLVSSRPYLHPSEEGVLRLLVDQNTTDFAMTANNLQPGKKYFYRAYASNEEGIALGSKETFVTQQQGPEPMWIDAQPGATKDWWISSWFGSFYQNPNGWALHEQLGWVFPVQSPTAGLWLWKEEMGWLWTDEGIYPFLYNNSNESWLYFYGQLDGSRLFYDYDRKEWIILRDDR